MKDVISEYISIFHIIGHYFRVKAHILVGGVGPVNIRTLKKGFPRK